MKRVFGCILIIAGILLLVAAGMMMIHGRQESKDSEQRITKLVNDLHEQVQKEKREPDQKLILEDIDVMSSEMAEKEIGGFLYIGSILIPSIGKELPILSQCTESNLMTAPCRYSGSIHTDDLVIAGHNYRSHFGGLASLKEGDQVTFVDVFGGTYEYEIVSIEILQPTQVEEMTEGIYDLTLFTCTYGGRTRLTIRCRRLNE